MGFSVLKKKAYYRKLINNYAYKEFNGPNKRWAYCGNWAVKEGIEKEEKVWPCMGKKPEEVVEICKNKLPILKEVKKQRNNFWSK